MESGAKLAHMANQVASFFRAYGHDAAVAGVHEHLVAFWTPRMRADLLARAEAGAEGLDPVVAEALNTLGTGRSPARRESAGPAELGAIDASDAG